MNSVMGVAMKRGGITTLIELLNEAEDGMKERAIMVAAKVGNMEIINRIFH